MSDNSADLLIEKHRTLPKEDPTGSFIILTMGLFIQALKLLAANNSMKLDFQFYKPLSEFTPEHIEKSEDELLPFARLSLAPQSARASDEPAYDNALFFTRRTSRLSFSPQTIPDDVRGPDIVKSRTRMGTDLQTRYHHRDYRTDSEAQH
ncbi:MAG TPA: hypothetical protein VJ875_10205 [Pyrinomonadaceae bacterium]|nr:hypothetical protein [Pyrinomonadaceae bacterium]